MIKNVLQIELACLLALLVLASCSKSNPTSSSPVASNSSVTGGSSSSYAYYGVGMTETQFNALSRASCVVYYVANPDSFSICMSQNMVSDSIRRAFSISCSGTVFNDTTGQLMTTLKTKLLATCPSGSVINCPIDSTTYTFYQKITGIANPTCTDYFKQ